jgi:WD40 repeat protein
MKVEIKKKKEIKLPSHCLSITRGPDSQLYAACVDGGVYLLDKKDKKDKIVSHDNFVSGVNVFNDMIVSVDYDGIIKWTAIDSRKEQKKIKAHKFWSWQSKVSPDSKMIGSVTGQYLAGGYKYEPSPETEPSIKVFDTLSGELIHKFSHVPPVQSLAFSNDSRYLAAGNLMGEVRVWDLSSGEMYTSWNTPSFTGWGIIKGHYYTGGVFSIEFSPDDSSIYLAGMGSTRDPAAGNGKQLWEEFLWRDEEKSPKRKRSAIDGEIGQGLMESLSFHPSGDFFVMAGRMFKGNWNIALFDTNTGNILCSQNSGIRCSDIVFGEDGTRFYIGGGKGQGKKKDDIFGSWGRIQEFEINIS